MEAKRPLKAQLQAELGAAADGDQQDAIRAAFAAREKAIVCYNWIEPEFKNAESELARVFCFSH